jgi:hypothetical protein
VRQVARSLSDPKVALKVVGRLLQQQILFRTIAVRLRVVVVVVVEGLLKLGIPLVFHGCGRVGEDPGACNGGK